MCHVCQYVCDVLVDVRGARGPAVHDAVAAVLGEGKRGEGAERSVLMYLVLCASGDGRDRGWRGEGTEGDVYNTHVCGWMRSSIGLGHVCVRIRM